jgi:hypothetical protein
LELLLEFFLNERARECANFIDREEENTRLAGKKKTFTTFTTKRSGSLGTLRLRRAKEKILP